MEFPGFHQQEYKQIDWKDYEGQPQVLLKEMSKRNIYRGNNEDKQMALEPFIPGSVYDTTTNWGKTAPDPTPQNVGKVVSVNGSNTTVNWMPPPPTPVSTSSSSNATNPPFYTTASFDNVSKNIATIQMIQKENVDTKNQIVSNYSELSENVDGLVKKIKYLDMNNEKYNYSNEEDPNVILRPEESKDIRTALQNDVTEMKLYQNSMYVTTSIACATLLIAAIVISK
jgi:hypothetical protein